MAIADIADQIREEIQRLQNALNALEGTTRRGRPRASGRRTLSAAARARIAAAQKARWAKWKAKKA